MKLVLKKILIVDDEKIARDRMHRFLNSYSEPLEIIEATNGPEAIAAILEGKPDIVLLDIQMPEMTGFDVLYQIELRNFQVIFQTAYDEFAIKAFEVNACDYLLKPYPEEKFHAALKKALLAQDQQLKLQHLENHLKQSKKFIKTLTTKVGSQTKIIDIQAIQYFKSEDHYTFAVTNENEFINEFIIDLSLNSLEEKLNPDDFVRCHRNCLVRFALIEKIGGADAPTIFLKGGAELLVSRENRKKIIQHLKLK